MATISIPGSPYSFSMDSDPPIIQFKDLTFRAFNEIRFKSHMFDFYAYGKVVLNDTQGIIVNIYNFVEGLTFKIKLGEKETGFLEQNLVWSENQLLNTGMRKVLGGKNNFVLISEGFKKDSEKSKANKNKIISNIVRQIVTSTFEVPPDKTFITTTTGLNDYPQQSETDKEFLVRLANLSYDGNNSQSPFFTFFNSAGEFYFMSLNDLFRQQPVETYEFMFDEIAPVHPLSVKTSQLFMGGMPVNRLNYKKDISSIDNTGEYKNTTENIEDYCIIGQGEKLLIRKADQQIKSQLQLGIMEKSNDSYIKQGMVNASFKNSALAYRISVMIQFNPKCVAGKTLKLKVYSNVQGKDVSPEYSGKWLIIEDQSLCSTEGKIYQNLLLGKSAIKTDINHPIQDFIS